MMITKMKLAKVSKPSQLAKSEKGPGKVAMIMKTIGRSSQATEFLIDMELRLREMIIMSKSINAAIVISTCRLVMAISPET